MTGKRILIVDDDDTFRLIAREALSHGGWIVEEAADGREARERLSRAAPDLILLDVMMPDVDGVALCREIRATDVYRTTPILVITALSDAKVARDALKAGATEFLVKPVDAGLLQIKARKILGH